MKTLSTEFTTVLSSNIQTLARCWKITRQDGIELSFTSFSKDLEIEGLIYKASLGFNPTAIASDLTFEPVNMELESVLNQKGINADELKRGLYDYARIHVFLVNYADLPISLDDTPPNYLTLLKGIIGKVSYTENTFKAEVLSLATLLSGTTSHTISKTCRYRFGDSKCTVDLTNHTYGLSVQAVGGSDADFFTSNLSFENDWFSGSKLVWTSGDNVGLEQLIIKSNGQNIYLQTKPPFPIQNGDTCNAIAACNKSETDCGKFNNRINFGGEPNIPGLDTYYSGEGY